MERTDISYDRSDEISESACIRVFVRYVDGAHSHLMTDALDAALADLTFHLTRATMEQQALAASIHRGSDALTYAIISSDSEQERLASVNAAIEQFRSMEAERARDLMTLALDSIELARLA